MTILTIALLILASLVIVALIALVAYQITDGSFFEWLLIFQPALNVLLNLLGAVIAALIKAISPK